MPKLPRLSGAEVVAGLTRLGFRQVRQKGSHVAMRREHTPCIVPLHRELKTGTLAGILRQAGITIEDLQNVL